MYGLTCRRLLLGDLFVVLEQLLDTWVYHIFEGVDVLILTYLRVIGTVSS